MNEYAVAGALYAGNLVQHLHASFLRENTHTLTTALVLCSVQNWN